MANNGLELSGEVVVNEIDPQKGIRHLYTILGWPRSIVISRNSKNNRPLYTAWSKFTCKLCPSENMESLSSLQYHMAEQHGLDLRGVTDYSIPGQLMVSVKPYDNSGMNYKFAYDLRQFTMHLDHNQDPLYMSINKVKLDRSSGGAACFLCPDDNHKFHSRDNLPQHILDKHGIDIGGRRWRRLVDETGYFVIDTRLKADPLSFPPKKQILSTADQESNDTKEGYLTAYDEKGMILYTLQPLIKPKLKNSRNDFLYHSDTECVCQICLQRPGTNPTPTLRLDELKRHMEYKHNIWLNHPYNRQPGQIQFQSTKVFDTEDELFDVNVTQLFCDQNGTPVFYRMVPPNVRANLAWFCLRCALLNGQTRYKSHVFDHLKQAHNILLHQDLTHSYLSPVGDSVFYLVEVDQLPPDGFTGCSDVRTNYQCPGATGTTPSSSNTGQSTPTTSRSKVKRHATKRKASKTGEDTLNMPKPKSKPETAKPDCPSCNFYIEHCALCKAKQQNIISQTPSEDCPFCQVVMEKCGLCKAKQQEMLISRTPSEDCPFCQVVMEKCGLCKTKEQEMLISRTPFEMAVTTKRSALDANLNPVGLAHLSSRPRISTNVTSGNTTQGIPLDDPNANYVGLYPAANTSNTAQVKCRICGKFFKNLDMDHHMQTAHNVETLLLIICQICKRPYDNQDSLRQHMMQEHPDTVPEPEGIQPAPVASSSQNLVTSAPSQSSVMQVDSSPETPTEEELCQSGNHGFWCGHFM